jgi:hypothetical protein
LIKGALARPAQNQYIQPDCARDFPQEIQQSASFPLASSVTAVNDEALFFCARACFRGVKVV